VRRKAVAGGKEGNKLNDAASIIADSFKSPAYRKAPVNSTPSNFTETYSRVQHSGAAGGECRV